MENRKEAVVLDGKAVAARWKRETSRAIKDYLPSDQPPVLAVVSVGDDPASKVYVRNKKRACEEVGIIFKGIELPADILQDELEHEITKLSDDDKVDGIILQLPIPTHLDSINAIECINQYKDVDGLTHHKAGWLMMDASNCVISPCTPLGIMEILRYYELTDPGHAVVVGRSNLVGKPLIPMLLGENWTVTVCHSKTEDLSSFTRQADLLIVAVGKPNMITADMVKPGAIVIDVGINRVDGKLCGDVDFESVKNVAGMITPVPGGVGATTVAALMSNTAIAAVTRPDRLWQRKFGR